MMQPLQSSSAVLVAFPAQALGMLGVSYQDGAAHCALSAALLCSKAVQDHRHHG